MLQQYRWNESWSITAKWVGIGTVGYLLDWLTYQASHTPFHHQLAIIFYWLMPVVAGYPVAWLDRRISNRTARLKFYYAFLIRALIFTAFSLLAGSVFLLLEEHTLYGHSAGWLMLKFSGFWLPASLFVLTTRNLLRHFDTETILEWIRGTYHLPTEEERVFLFMDIKDSTSIAESLGNKRYFDFIQEFHHLAADAIKKNEGEVYQYIGDEIVITWPLKKGLRNDNAINLFFQVEQTLAQNAFSFYEQFQTIPAIKGSLHAGTVTRGEVGKAKREFGYVGHVINTTARMQSVAKETPGVSLVVSEGLLNRFIGLKERLHGERLGSFAFRGKNEQVVLYTLKGASGPRDTMEEAAIAV